MNPIILTLYSGAHVHPCALAAVDDEQAPTRVLAFADAPSYPVRRDRNSQRKRRGAGDWRAADAIGGLPKRVARMTLHHALLIGADQANEHG